MVRAQARSAKRSRRKARRVTRRQEPPVRTRESLATTQGTRAQSARSDEASKTAGDHGGAAGFSTGGWRGGAGITSRDGEGPYPPRITALLRCKNERYVHCCRSAAARKCPAADTLGNAATQPAITLRITGGRCTGHTAARGDRDGHCNARR